MRKNSYYIISKSPNVLVLVTDKKFEVDRWIRKLVLVNPRANGEGLLPRGLRCLV